MDLFLTIDAVLRCPDRGAVHIKASRQDLCTIERRTVLVDNDPEGCAITGCSNVNIAAGFRPCVTTLAVKEGYSDFIRIDGRSVCLSSVWGLTDGTPPGTKKYEVADAGQTLVRTG